jgi:hypothetical protein
MSEDREPRRHSKHVFRAFILLGLVLVALFLVRSLVRPSGWGEYGNFRTGAVAEMIAIEPVYGDEESCRSCHEKRWEERAGGKHATVPCESCHDALTSHVRDGKKVSKMASDRSYELCARCHRKIQGRPEGFAQVKLDEHMADMGGSPGAEACLDCHNPHHPLDGLK